MKHAGTSTNASEWRRFDAQQFSGRVLDWQRWFAAADELQFAAELIRPQVISWWIAVVAWRDTQVRPRAFPPLGCHSILMMLYAYVIENLCKGALIRDRRIDLSTTELPTPKLPPLLKGHGLRKLAGQVGMKCDDLEQELLARMERAAVWRGRYPAAIRYDESNDTVRLDSGKKHSTSWFAEKDIQRIETLIGRLRQHVEATRSFTVARDAAP